MGAEAIRKLLTDLDLVELSQSLRRELDETNSKQKKKDLINRLRQYAPKKVAGLESLEKQSERQTEAGVSESLAALIPQVLDSIAKEIQIIKKALYENDQETVAKTSHAVKGLAGFYGFDRLSGLLEHLEDSGIVEGHRVDVDGRRYRNIRSD